MDKKLLAIMIFAVSLLFVAGCEDGGFFWNATNNSFFNDTDFENTTINDTIGAQEAIATARDWVTSNSTTYAYDGSNLRLANAEELECLGCWNVTLRFDSAQAGYGNRSGEVTAQVITNHTIEVGLENRTVVSAVTDGIYDEISQELLNQTQMNETENRPVLDVDRNEAIDVAENWIREEAHTFIEAGANLEFEGAFNGTCDECYNVVFSFDALQEGYGQDLLYEDMRNSASVDHTIIVGVEDGVVVSAITDGIFDEYNQELIETQTEEDAEELEQEAADTAETWIRSNAETYIYDGSELTLEEVDEGSCAGCWEVTYEFVSENDGYGDRTGNNTIEEDSTRHAITVEVEDGVVVSAVTDGLYDEMDEEFIS